MIDYAIKETFTLPSHGMIYNVPVNPEVSLKSMTTTHEMMRLSPSEDAFRNMCEVIDDCMINNPGISSYDMCLGDYVFLMHKLRIVTYGSNFPTMNICPYCGSINKDTVNLEDLTVKEYEDSMDLNKLMVFDLPRSKRTVRIKYRTPRILDKIQSRAKEFKKKSNNSNDQTLVFLIQELVEEIDGRRVDPISLDSWARNLEMLDVQTILSHADALDNIFGLDTTLDNVCDVCGLEFQSAFKSNSEFFRPTLDI